jgi:hypothetical protein
MVDADGGRAFAPERRQELAGEADRADADGRGTGQLLGPAGEVQALVAVQFGELRLPEAALGTVAPRAGRR